MATLTAALLKLHSLRLLSLQRNGINALAAAVVETVCSLRNDGAALEPLLHSLKRNGHLATLNLSGNRLSRNAIDYLALAVRSNLSVKRFQMTDLLFVDDCGAGSLAALATRTNVAEYGVDPSGNEHELAQALAVAMHSGCACG